MRPIYTALLICRMGNITRKRYFVVRYGLSLFKKSLSACCGMCNAIVLPLFVISLWPLAKKKSGPQTGSALTDETLAGSGEQTEELSSVDCHKSQNHGSPLKVD